MSAMKLTMVATALGLFGMASHAQAQSPLQQVYGGYGQGQLVTCESTDGRYRECGMDTRGGVQLVRQVSRAQCIEGRSWGVGRNGVWVNNGCRAQFASNAGGRHGNQYGQGQTIRCESTNGRYRECAISTRGGVQLVRQISGAQCIQGRSWGQNRDSIWVNNGCRAEFAVGMGPGRGYGFGRNQNNRGQNNNHQGNNRGWGNQRGGIQQVIHCASDGGRQNFCPANINRGVSIQRQTSRAQCIEGRTWGTQRGGVWVSNGCRADFAVY